MTERKHEPDIIKRPAKWQFHWDKLWIFTAGMFLLLCIISLLNEVLDFPHILVGAQETPINWEETAIEIFLIVAVGIFSVLVLNRLTNESKRAEETLLECEKMYGVSIFETSGTAMAIVEEDTTISLANEGFERLSGFSRKEIEGKKSWTEFVVKDDLEMMKRQHDLRRKDHDNAMKEYEFRFLDRDENVKTIFLTIDMIPGTSKSVASLLDITERNKAEEALWNSQEAWMTAFDAMTWVSLIDPDTHTIINCNKAGEEITGRPINEIIGNKYYIMAHNSDEPHPDCPVQRMLKSKNREEIEIKLGECGPWLLVSVDPVFNENKEIIHVVHIVKDITDRKLAEKVMQENEEKFRAVFNEALDGIVLINADNGMIVDANPEFQRITGRSISQLRTMNIWDIRPENDIDQAKRNFKEFTKSDKKLAARNVSYQQPSGKIVPVEAKAQKVVIRNREYILSIARDATERIRSEKEIKISEEKFRNLFEESLDAVYITDYDGTINDMNPAGCRMLGYSRDELIGENAANTYVNEEDRIRLQEEIEDKGSVKNFEVALKKKDGSRILCVINATSIEDRDGNITGYQGIIHDLTNRIIIEQRYREEFQRAEFYNDLMSHDVRNYNQGIMSNLELLNMSEDLPEDVKRFSKNALNQVIGSSRLITNLQTLSDLKHSKASLNNMDVIPFIEEALDYTKTSFPDKNIIVDFPDDGRSVIVKGNSMLLEVLNNILSNTVKFDRSQEVHIEIKITEDDEFYKFEFKDQGPGIKDNMKTRVFDRNIRTDEEIWGTGLGLTLVKQIVESHDGHIWVEDRIEGERTKGSNFIITLPRGDAPG